MAVASTPLVAAPSCPAWAKRRRGFPPQFDGEPCEPAEEEDVWLCRADGRARSTAELKRLAAAARQRTKYDRDAAAASRRDQQARSQRRRQVANVQVPWSEIRGTCFRTHPQQLAVAAAAAASHPELDDGKIIPEATVDSQVRPEPPARSPPTPSPVD